MNKAARYLSDILIVNRIIDVKDRDIYEYGIRAMLTNVPPTILLGILGAMLYKPIFTIFYYISIKIIRGKYGVIHAKTRLQCFIITILIYLISVFLTVVCFSKLNIIILGISIICFFYLFSANKYAADTKTEVNKHQKLLYNLKPAVLVIMFFVFYFIGQLEISYGIYATFSSVVLLELLLARIIAKKLIQTKNKL